MGPVSSSTFAYGRCDLTNANGPKLTSHPPLWMSVVGGKRTSSCHRPMSPFDPKQMRWMAPAHGI